MCGSYIVSDPPLHFKDTFFVVVLGSRAFNSEHGIRGLHIFCGQNKGSNSKVFFFLFARKRDIIQEQSRYKVDCFPTLEKYYKDLPLPKTTRDER